MVLSGKMSYIEENLLPGEKVIYRAHPHWIILLIPFLALIVGFVLLIYSTISTEGFGVILSLSCILVGLLVGISEAVTYFTTEFALTDKRVIAKEGLIRRRSVELLLAQIESVGVNQPIVGRLLNFGTVTVVGTGGTREPFKAITDPMELRREVHSQLIQ